MEPEIVSSERDIKEFEFRLFCNLPSHLKNKVFDLEDNEIIFSDIDPLSIVCIQVSNNPGVKPFLINHQQTTFDLFKKISEREGFSIDEFNTKLKLKIGVE